MTTTNPSTPLCWSVDRLDSLSLFQKTRLTESDLSSSSKMRLKTLFSNVLNDPKVTPYLQSSQGTLHFDFDVSERDGFLLRTGEEKTGRSVAPFAELIEGKGAFGALFKELKKIERFAEQKGICVKSFRAETIEREILPGESLKRQAYHKSIEPLLVFFEKDRCLLHSCSLVRNGTMTVVDGAALPLKHITGLQSTLSGIGVAQGGLMAVGGAINIGRGIREARKSIQNRDGEGAIRGGMLSLQGAGNVVSGVSLQVRSGTVLAGSAMSAASLLAMHVGGVAMNGILAINSLFGWKLVRDFRLELKEILKNPSEPARLSETLRWIRSQVVLSELEISEIYGRASKREDIPKEIEKALEKKWARFERRTSSNCRKLICEKLGSFDSLLEKIKENDPLAIQTVKELVGKVEEANYKERVRLKILTFLAFLGIAAFTGLLLFFGPFSHILFVLGALIWLTVDWKALHAKIADRVWQRHVRSIALT